MKNVILLLVILLFNLNLLNSQWIEQNSGVNVQLNCVSSLNSAVENGWVCGNNGVVLKTTDGGNNWINVSSNIPSNVNLTSILGMNNFYSRAIVSGTDASNVTRVYYTSNGGANWQVTFTQNSGHIYSLLDVLFSSHIMIIGKPVGGRWTLYNSSNQGITWDSTGLYLQQVNNETGFDNSAFAIEYKLWIGTNNARIYYSPYAGTQWSVQSTLPEINTPVIWFQYLLTDNSAVGYGLTGGTGLLKTTNLGNIWNSVTTSGNGNITGIAGSPSSFSKSWFTKENKIYTGIEGLNWTLEYTAPSGNYKNINNNRTGSPHIWAVRDNGGISKYTGQIGIQQISSEIPDKFSLSQNYPNPFNPSTNINFSIPAVETTRWVVSLLVYDITGREVATLVNQSLTPGTYSVNWDASNYPSGIYFYRLTSGDFSQTNKMILIK